MTTTESTTSREAQTVADPGIPVITIPRELDELLAAGRA